MSEETLKKFGLDKNGVGTITREENDRNRDEYFDKAIEAATDVKDIQGLMLAKKLAKAYGDSMFDIKDAGLNFIELMQTLAAATAAAISPLMAPANQPELITELRKVLPPAAGQMSGPRIAMGFFMGAFGELMHGQICLQEEDAHPFRVTRDGEEG